MICKKCGAPVSDNSKFCGTCGAIVEVPTIQNNVASTTESNSINVKEDNLSTTNVVNNVVEQPTITTPETMVNQSIEQPNNNLNNSVVTPVNDNSMESTQGVQTVDTANNTSNQESTKKKNNKLIFIIGGVVLALVAIITLVIALSSSSSGSIEPLNKALNNFKEVGQNSGTITAKMVLESSSEDSMNFSAAVKYAKVDEAYDMELTLNKSLLYDEMSLYLSGTSDDITLYAKSSVVDLLGMTYSDTDSWLYYFIDLDSLEEEISIEETDDSNIDLSEVIDSKHLSYVGEESGLKHYRLTIDNELMNDLKSKVSNEEAAEIDSYLSSEETVEILNKGLDIDFYVNSSDELQTVSMDLTKFLEDTDSDVTKFIFSIEFSDFNNTVVSIPSEALHSTVDLESYFTNYSVQTDDSYDYDYSYDYNYEYEDYNYEYEEYENYYENYNYDYGV